MAQRLVASCTRPVRTPTAPPGLESRSAGPYLFTYCLLTCQPQGGRLGIASILRRGQ